MEFPGRLQARQEHREQSTTAQVDFLTGMAAKFESGIVWVFIGQSWIEPHFIPVRTPI